MTDYPHDKVEFGTNGYENTSDIERTPSGQYISPEDAELARLGYKQEFKREFGWLATFSFAFSISGLLATVTFPS